MPLRSVAVILNPAAGNRRAGRARAQLRQALDASGVPFEIFATERPNHASALARRAATRFDAVLAGGGDGTVQEVATGLLDASDTLFGIVPLGTGNDFAKLLGVPKRPADAVRALLDAEAVPVDAGTVRWQDAGVATRIHEAVFVNAVGVGFDALVAAEVDRLKLFRGISGYIAGVWKALRVWEQPEAEVRGAFVAAGDETAPEDTEPLYAGPFFLAAVSNGVSVGGGFRLTPNARIDDGLLDLCLVAGPLSLARILTLLPKAIAGRHLGEPEVMTERVDRLALRLSAGVPIHVDGEVLTRTAVEVEVGVRPAAFRMLRPRQAR